MVNFEQYTDIEIINKVLQGEIALFEMLIRRNNPFLYKLGRSYGYNHEDTEDLMQDSFVDAYANLSKFENRSSFKTWILKIMLHNCYKLHKKSSFKNEVFMDINEKSNPMYSNQQYIDPGKIILNRELTFVIENALKHIPEDYRLVFSLREVNKLTVKETAETLNITEANVKVRLNRAKAMLRTQVQKSYKAEDVFEFNLVYCDAIVKRVMDKINNTTK